MLVYVGVTMAVLFFVSIPVMLVTRSGTLPMWFARRVWAPSSLWLASVRLDVRRLASIPDGPAIFAANHESALDILAVVAAVPRTVRFVAKEELFRLPVFGWHLALGGHVRVDRSDHARAVASLAEAARIVRAGTSLIVFPEGTRSRDGRVHPFKKGPFVIAMEAGSPVVPIAVSGAGAINPKGRIEVHPGTLHVSIGTAVHPRDFADRTALLREVRHRIIEMHRETGGLGGDVDDAVAARGLEGTSAAP